MFAECKKHIGLLHSANVILFLLLWLTTKIFKMNYKRFSERLNLFIYEQGLNPDQLSKLLKNSDGKSPSSKSIYNYSTGENKPGLEFLQMLSSYFPNLNLTWLIKGVGDMYNNKPHDESELINFDDTHLKNRIGNFQSFIEALEERIKKLENK